MSGETVIDGVDIRTVVPLGKDTIRTKIIQAMLDHAEDADFDEDYPVLAGGAKLFDIVKKGTLDDLSTRETPGLAIEEGSESVTELIYQKVDKRLRVYFNVKVVRAQGIDADALINYYFARIAKLYVTTTGHFAGLAIDIAEAGNSIQTNGSSDPEPGGTIYFDVDYRHARGDLLTE